MARIELPQRGLHLEYESHGSDKHPAVILIMHFSNGYSRTDLKRRRGAM